MTSYQHEQGAIISYSDEPIVAYDASGRCSRHQQVSCVILVACVLLPLAIMNAFDGKYSDLWDLQLAQVPGASLHSDLRELNSTISGTVFFSSDCSFADSNSVWLRRLNQPMAIIEVDSESDVQESLSVLKRHKGTPFAIRSGGHHKLGYSTNKVVISTKRLNRVEFLMPKTGPSELVRVRIGPAVTAQQFLGNITAATGYGGVIGFCPYVAEGGFVLGGGFGLQSRLYGLGADQVTAMSIVLADGRLLTTSEVKNQDLFIALRGAGSGSLGVVTSIEYMVHPVSDTVHFCSLAIPPLQDRNVLYRLGEKESSLPGNVIAMYDIKNTINFAWTGHSELDVKGGDIILQQLARSLLANATVQCSTVSWTKMYGTEQFAKNNSDVFDWGRSVYGAACWTGFLMNNTQEFWDVVSDVFAAIFAQTQYVVPDVEMWGGAIRTNPARTSFGYRNATFNVGLLLMVPMVENAEAIFLQESAIVDAAWPKVEAFLEGSYVNYPSAYLFEHADYARVLWGKNLEALVRVKQKYDPDNFFRHPMSIPVSL